MYPNTRYLHATNFISGELYKGTHAVKSYFSLKEENQTLSWENTKLRQQLLDIQKKKIDSLDKEMVIHFALHKYKVLRGEVVKNNFHLTKNYFLINKGEKDSVFLDMGVISPKGVVGIVEKTSENFAGVQSLLNTQSRLSVALKNSGHYGMLNWDGKEINKTQLLDIPNTAEVKIGDTIVTDGRSKIFPKGIPVGKVVHIGKNPTDLSLLIDIQLFADMTNLQHIYIIRNKNQEELMNLEVEYE